MTQPNTPPDGGNNTPPAPEQKAPEKKYRPGQVIKFRVEDPVTGADLQGHALVLKVNAENLDVAILGAGHLQVPLDNATPAQASDVHNPLPAPEPAAEGSTGS